VGAPIPCDDPAPERHFPWRDETHDVSRFSRLALNIGSRLTPWDAEFRFIRVGRIVRTTMSAIDRRTFLELAGIAALPALAGCSSGGEASEVAYDFVDEEPDYAGWFDDVPNYEGTVDRTGEREVRVVNGAGPSGKQFEPPAIRVDTDTTVVWEWTGDGSHNVVAESGAFRSDIVQKSGFTFEHTFEERSIYEYVCEPHRTVGMKGAVVVR
jgi:halocyanin-like protein